MHIRRSWEDKDGIGNIKENVGMGDGYKRLGT